MIKTIKNEENNKIDRNRDNLEYLKDLTDKLVSFSDLVTFSVPGFSSIGEGTQDELLMYSLFSPPEKDISVIRACMHKGAVLNRHIHPKEQEWVLLWSGKCEIEHFHGLDKQEKIICTGPSMAYFEPGEPHCITILEDSLFIGISVPAADGYPVG